MISHNNQMWETAPDLYLPSNAQTLFAALASALGTDHPAEIIYLDDDGVLPAYIAEKVRDHFPQVTLKVHSDRAAIEEFATLPATFPGVLRRNIAPTWRYGFSRPKDRQPHWLGLRYRTAYIYLSGKFVAKTLRKRCGKVILREEGLGNYHSLPFGRGKALVRLITGRSPWRQIMGEESWVDQVEISRPEALPATIQAKATQLTLMDLLNRISMQTARDLALIFWQGTPPPSVEGNALILTQPIDRFGFCTTEKKNEIYETIKQRLIHAGFKVMIKRHPREAHDISAGADTEIIPPFFPIEAWPWLTNSRFELSVALCSSALDTLGDLFSHQQLQLVDPVIFGQKQLGNWQKVLELWCATYRE